MAKIWILCKARKESHPIPCTIIVACNIYRGCRFPLWGNSHLQTFLPEPKIVRRWEPSGLIAAPSFLSSLILGRDSWWTMLLPNEWPNLFRDHQSLCQIQLSQPSISSLQISIGHKWKPFPLECYRSYKSKFHQGWRERQQRRCHVSPMTKTMVFSLKFPVHFFNSSFIASNPLVMTTR